MRECPYELYVAISEAVRQGLTARDADIVRRVSALIGARPGIEGLVMTLALVEAKRGEPQRPKEEVCRLCTERCSAAVDRR